MPLRELADLKLSYGPSMIRDENGMLAGYVYLNLDSGRYELFGGCRTQLPTTTRVRPM